MVIDRKWDLSIETFVEFRSSCNRDLAIFLTNSTVIWLLCRVYVLSITGIMERPLVVLSIPNYITVTLGRRFVSIVSCALSFSGTKNKVKRGNSYFWCIRGMLFIRVILYLRKCYSWNMVWMASDDPDQVFFESIPNHPRWLRWPFLILLRSSSVVMRTVWTLSTTSNILLARFQLSGMCLVQTNGDLCLGHVPKW